MDDADKLRFLARVLNPLDVDQLQGLNTEEVAKDLRRIADRLAPNDVDPKRRDRLPFTAGRFGP